MEYYLYDPLRPVVSLPDPKISDGKPCKPMDVEVSCIICEIDRDDYDYHYTGGIPLDAIAYGIKNIKKYRLRDVVLQTQRGETEPDEHLIYVKMIGKRKANPQEMKRIVQKYYDAIRVRAWRIEEDSKDLTPELIAEAKEEHRKRMGWPKEAK